MAESLVELVKRVAAEYEAAKSTGEISERSEKRSRDTPLSSHISLISHHETVQKDQLPLGPSRLRDRYEERAAIHQFDGREDRVRAETRAWNTVAAIWYRQHGERTPSSLCAGCGGLIGCVGVIALPLGERVHVGIGDGAYRCIRLYERRWKGAAAVALAALGIPPPAEEKVETA